MSFTRLRPYLLGSLKFAVTVGLVWIVWARIEALPGVESERFGLLMEHTSLRWFLAALGVMAISVATGAAQWRILLARQGIAMTYIKLLRISLVGMFFNLFMPGNIGGDIKKMYDAKEASGTRAGAAITATLFDRIFGLFFLNGLALGVGFLFFVHDAGARVYLLPSLWLFLGFLLFFTALLSRRLGRLMQRVVDRMAPAWIGERFASVRERFNRYREPSLLIQIIVISAVTQILRVLVHYFCGLAIGVDIPVSWYCYFIPVVALVSALPISIGGFGPRELLAQSLFSVAGVGRMDSVVIQLLAYFVSLVIALAGAVEFLLSRQGHPRMQAPEA